MGSGSVVWGIGGLGVICVAQVDLKVQVVAPGGTARGVAGVAFDAQSSAHGNSISDAEAGAAGLAVVKLEHEARIVGHASNDVFALVLVRPGRRNL